MKKNDEQISIWKELNTIRLLVFIESEPFSNKYYQVFLNSDQFKRLSEKIPFEENKGLKVSDEIYVLPDLHQINDK